MNVHIVTSHSSPCELSTFAVNDMEAETCDFVSCYDHDQDSAAEYGCGDLRADVKEVSTDILEKYEITAEEFHDIAGQVVKALAVGFCCLCQ